MSSIFTFCTLFAIITASEANVHVQNPEEQWLITYRADQKEVVHMTFALKQVNTNWLDEMLSAVSDPDSPKYGQHMSLEEVTSHVYADPTAVVKIRDLFSSFNIEPQLTMGGGFAKVDIPVYVAEQLFSAQFYHYRHRTKTDLTTIRTVAYTVPELIAPYIDFVCCIDKLPSSNVIGVQYSYNTLGLSVTPASISSDYNVGDYQASNSKTSQAVAGFLKQYFSPTDLKQFQEKFDIPENPIVKVVGKNTPLLAGVEASLDVEYITGVGKKVATWFLSISTYSNKGQEDFLSWLITLVNTSNVPLVHSVSYGDYEDTIDVKYMMRCEDEFKKLGIMGVTILFASGDSGANCHGRESKFRPNWPASSPSITTVGGTVSLEEVWDGGGGGFSNIFPTPDYQTLAVKNFLENGDPPPSKYFNSSGRAYPDVSAFATGFEIIMDKGGMVVDGTSCAAPTTAGIISLLNDVRLNKGMSSLGFLNPLLYKQLGPNGFFDITKGKNGEGFSCPGFKASKGWDPASGWGSPNFKLLKELVVQ